MEIEIIDTISKDPEFDYLRPKGQLILKLDSIHDVPKIDIFFNDWYSTLIVLDSGLKMIKLVRIF